MRITLKKINRLLEKYGLEIVKWNDSYSEYYYYSSINDDGDKIMMNASDGTIHCHQLNEMNIVKHIETFSTFIESTMENK
jgi:hypothetical protein